MQTIYLGCFFSEQQCRAQFSNCIPLVPLRSIKDFLRSKMAVKLPRKTAYALPELSLYHVERLQVGFVLPCNLYSHRETVRPIETGQCQELSGRNIHQNTLQHAGVTKKPVWEGLPDSSKFENSLFQERTIVFQFASGFNQNIMGLKTDVS